MNQPGPEQKDRLISATNLTASGLAVQLGLVIPGIIIAAVLGGVWLDKVFTTDGHLFVILLLVVSLPLSIYLTFKMAMRAVKNIHESMKPQAMNDPIQPKEDETGEQ